MKKHKLLLIAAILVTGLHGVSSQTNVERIWTNPYVLSNANESFSFQIETNSTSDYFDSIVVDLLTPTLEQNNESIRKLKFLDDGEGDDRAALDGIYTASNIRQTTYKNDNLLSINPRGREYRIFDLKTYIGAIGSNDEFEGIFNIKLFKPDTLPVVNILDSITQYTTHVLNIVDSAADAITLNLEQMASTYYDIFKDDKHMLVINSTEFSRSDPRLKVVPVSNEVEGVGLKLFDMSDDYGSNTLESIILLSGNTIRDELLIGVHRRFALYLPEKFKLNNNGSINTLNGNGFGHSSYFTSQGGGSYAIYFYQFNYGALNELEMYLHGFIGINEIDFPIKVLPSYNYIGPNPDGSIWATSYDTVVEISKQMIIDSIGVRSPSHIEFRKGHNIGLIVKSKRLLTAGELSYFHQLMVEHEKKENSLFNIWSYYSRTHGEGELNTRLDPKTVSVNKVEIGNQIRVYPNPASILLNVEISNCEFSSCTCRLFMFDTMGTCVKKADIKGGDYELNVASLKSGIYLIVVETEEESHLQKIVLSRSN